MSEWRAKMTWAQRLQRVFGIDVEPCPSCGGAVRIIACIEDPDVFKKILTYLDAQSAPQQPGSALPPSRASPEPGLFGELNEPVRH